MAFERPQISNEMMDNVIKQVRERFLAKTAKKGKGGFVSITEIFGKMSEEIHETIMELHHKDKDRMADELIDVAVVAILGVASISLMDKK